MSSLNLTPKPPQQIAHIVINCHHFEATKQWYQQVFNTTERFGNEFVSFTSYDDEHHRLAFFNAGEGEASADTGPGQPAGVQHFAYSYADVASLLALYQRLAQIDILPVWAVHHGISLSLYYQDPEGIQVEFQVDAFTDSSAAIDYMASDAFAQNPIGVGFEVEHLLQRFEQGESEQQLLDQQALGA